MSPASSYRAPPAISTLLRWPTPSKSIHRFGLILGSEALKVFEGTPTTETSQLRLASSTLQLPGLMLFAKEAEGLGLVADLQKEVDTLRAKGTPPDQMYWPQIRLSRAQAMLQSVRTSTPLPTVPAELNALSFGDAALVSGPGEIFNEIGVEIKTRSPIGGTCYVGYTNGRIDYVPVPSAYPEGGYEVTHLCRVGPQAAPMIVAKSLELLSSLAGKP